MTHPIHAKIPVDKTVVVFRNYVPDSSTVMLCLAGRDLPDYFSSRVRPKVMIYEAQTPDTPRQELILDANLNFVSVRVPKEGWVAIKAQFETHQSGVASKGEVDYAVFPFGGV